LENVLANFNIGIDCESTEMAEKLSAHISSLDLYQDQLDVCDERVSVVTKQSLLQELENFSTVHKTTLSVECWPEGLDYDEAEEQDSLEFFTYG
jgi:hypothetical protein